MRVVTTIIVLFVLAHATQAVAQSADSTEQTLIEQLYELSATEDLDGDALTFAIERWMQYGSQAHLDEIGLLDLSTPQISGGGLRTAAPMMLKLRSRYLQDPDAHQQRGYQRNQVVGSSSKLYNRLWGAVEGLTVGVLASKDPGETSPADNLKGFADYNGALALFGDASEVHAIAGHYTIAFGQGLHFGPGFGGGKSVNVISAALPKTRGIAGYASTGGSTHFMGAAAEFALGPIKTSFFYSRRLFDAALDTTGISSIDVDGYHRTEDELAKRDAARVDLLGTRANLTIEGTELTTSLGAIASSVRYAPELSPKPYKLSGGGQSMVSLDGTLTYKKLFVGSEAARVLDASGAMALALVAVYRADRRMSFVAQYRNLAENFISPFGSTFQEGSGVANENGIYLGIETKSVDQAWKLAAYADIATTKDRVLTLGRPQRSFDWMCNLAWQPLKEFGLQLRYRGNSKEDQATLMDSLKRSARVMETGRKHTYRLSLNSGPLESITIKARYELVQVTSDLFNLASVSGFVVGGELQWRHSDFLRVGGSFFSFRADSYDARLYAFDASLEGYSTFRALYGKGYRAGFTLSLKVLEFARVAVMASEMRLTEPRKMGSGVTERVSDRERTFGLQTDISF